MATLNQQELSKFIVAQYEKLLVEGRQREGRILIELKDEFLGKKRREIIGKHVRNVKQKYLEKQGNAKS